MEHQFTATIRLILREDFDNHADDLYQRSEILLYLNEKTRSASRGSKARSAFANLYGIYVLVEDYIRQGFLTHGDYNEYEGARFADLFKRQRELPFGSKLQNHALNHRLNQEFAKFFPTCQYQPVMREPKTKRYWINQNLLNVTVRDQTFNLAPTIIKIIDAYIKAKRDAFEGFINDCERMTSLQESDPHEVREFIRSRLEPNVDARVFEIVSYAILKGILRLAVHFLGMDNR